MANVIKYGVLGTWTNTPARREEEELGLREMVVPMAKRQPGFVAGYWLADWAEGKSYSLIILEDENSARRFKSLVDENPFNREEAGVSRDAMVVVPVIAEVGG